MRTLIIALVAFMIVVAIWFVVMDYMNDSINELISIDNQVNEYVVKEDWDAALDTLDYFTERWNTHQSIYHLFLDQDNIMEVTYAISEAKIFIQYQDAPSSLGRLAFIKDQLHFLHRNELVSLENIF
ncbi:MAG: DUF4363 family protein [Clostridia bacterium]|nr:DUF4363 family protein [Clostridia bacterium]